MPFDGSDNTPALNRARLIEALRAEMPEGFGWDYGMEYQEMRCGAVGCALGLAQAIGLLSEGWELADVESAFGMTGFQMGDVFYNPANYGFDQRGYHDVTPAMVADALERLT